jgi:hypothetical protein
MSTEMLGGYDWVRFEFLTNHSLPSLVLIM